MHFEQKETKETKNAEKSTRELAGVIWLIEVRFLPSRQEWVGRFPDSGESGFVWRLRAHGERLALSEAAVGAVFRGTAATGVSAQKSRRRLFEAQCMAFARPSRVTGVVDGLVLRGRLPVECDVRSLRQVPFKEI